MPSLSSDELSSWIAEFRARGAGDAADPRAIDVSWDGSLIDTALIVARLGTSGTEVYLKRDIGGSPEWTVTFEARESDAQVSAEQVMTLATEVLAVGRLCAFLTERTAQHLREVAARTGAPTPAASDT
ncbi:hypothetical protein [Curtobacterium sp. MCSS17_015]|uniref:hypothetical protein n=1 Tax=Curtobacterium sp. MCSS17_015 TaxID=2175666 RepID=UPI000DA7CE2F|nr:hypothetical protein [Curtobacterium sp. MCSS17_015]WIB26319.1 hypothetical protein DEJ18_14910 [Curtobacterium sp. MCSS17_015]